ncbi:MAG: hypothetical protein GXP24_02950 [Planctomycetes bacterium]|nr:hypothetical protein [Planctomycetota bacterium]
MQNLKRAQSAFFVGVIFLFLGCGSETKVQQIQKGVENVERHAKEIEKAAQPPAK